MTEQKEVGELQPESQEGLKVKLRAAEPLLHQSLHPESQEGLKDVPKRFSFAVGVDQSRISRRVESMYILSPGNVATATPESQEGLKDVIMSRAPTLSSTQARISRRVERRFRRRTRV